MAPGDPKTLPALRPERLVNVSQETSRMFNDRAERPALERVLASALQLRGPCGSESKLRDLSQFTEF